MPELTNYENNAKTLAVDANNFSFETVEQQSGHATVIRFKLDDPRYKLGDLLVVLSGTEIHFHGMIQTVEEGWAIASDHRDSLLPATIQ